MHARPSSVVTLVSALLLACGSEREVTSPVVDEPVEPIDLTGSYKVSGVTIELESGARRDIGGMLILTQEGDAYSAKFHLSTMYPTPDGILPADVVGQGEGRIEGRKLSGSAETQLIFGIVPGEAGNFPMAPRIYGPRLVSRSTGGIDADGKLEFVSENAAAPGEAYPATRTTLEGSRVETDWTRGAAREE
jgi:hypothetical protein